MKRKSKRDLSQFETGSSAFISVKDKEESKPENDLLLDKISEEDIEEICDYMNSSL